MYNKIAVKTVAKTISAKESVVMGPEILNGIKGAKGAKPLLVSESPKRWRK